MNTLIDCRLSFQSMYVNIIKYTGTSCTISILGHNKLCPLFLLRSFSFLLRHIIQRVLYYCNWFHCTTISWFKFKKMEIQVDTSTTLSILLYLTHYAHSLSLKWEGLINLTIVSVLKFFFFSHQAVGQWSLNF